MASVLVLLIGIQTFDVSLFRMWRISADVCNVDGLVYIYIWVRRQFSMMMSSEGTATVLSWNIAWLKNSGSMTIMTHFRGTPDVNANISSRSVLARNQVPYSSSSRRPNFRRARDADEVP